VPEPIAPPAARRPEEAIELVSLAVSDGDLGAALAQYEDGAPLRPGVRDGCAAGVRDGILGVMELRLPLAVEISTVLPAAGLALVLAERRIAGTGPDGEPVRLSGLGCTVVRAQPDGTWRIAADAWRLRDAG
jgi:ketosteroid isomerase-like protein